MEVHKFSSFFQSFIFLTVFVPLTAFSKGQGAQVFFISPKDGAKVANPITVKFGVKGYKIRKAGIMDSHTGHHHLLIDKQAIAKGEIVPADENHIHFGNGQTETSISLPPGPHTLTLQFADGAHKSYGPELSATIKITVQEPNVAQKVAP